MKMKSISLGPIVILGVFGPVSASFASGYDSSASYSVTASAYHTFSQVSTDFDENAVHSADLAPPAETSWNYSPSYKGDVYGAPYSAGAATDGHVVASSGILAIQSNGSVNGSASAPSQIGAADPNFIINNATGLVDFSTDAKWTDTVTFRKPGAPWESRTQFIHCCGYLERLW